MKSNKLETKRKNLNCKKINLKMIRSCIGCKEYLEDFQVLQSLLTVISSLL